MFKHDQAGTLAATGHCNFSGAKKFLGVVNANPPGSLTFSCIFLVRVEGSFKFFYQSIALLNYSDSDFWAIDFAGIKLISFCSSAYDLHFSTQLEYAISFDSSANIYFSDHDQIISESCCFESSANKFGLV
jgi:hypothetical protein